jgi:hypothetical protein
VIYFVLEIGSSFMVVAVVGTALFLAMALLLATANGAVAFARLLHDLASETATALAELRRSWRSNGRVRTAE